MNLSVHSPFSTEQVVRSVDKEHGSREPYRLTSLGRSAPICPEHLAEAIRGLEQDLLRGPSRSPFHTRAAVAVRVCWPGRTRTMPWVAAGRGHWTSPGGVLGSQAMATGPVSSAVGRSPVGAKARATGSECRNGGSVNSKREGRRRRAAASRPPFSGGLHGVGAREPLPGTASAGVMPRPN